MRRQVLTILLVLCAISATAQIGQRFWFAAPEMAKHSGDMQLRLCVFADSLEADVTISMPASIDMPAQRIHVQKHGHQQVVLAQDYTNYMRTLAVKHNLVMPRAVMIEATAPITCYIQMTGVNGEVYTLKGENALGEEFVLAMQNRFTNANSLTTNYLYEDAYASAQVVATEDSTVVEIYPTQLLYGDTAIVPRKVVINKGEVYSIRAVSKRAQAHPTATRIKASKSIAVFTMDDSMSPYQKHYGEDAVADQLVPLSLLGQDYVALSHGLKWEGVFVTDLETDTTEFIPMQGKEALYIHRDHPVQVYQVTGYGNEAGGTQLPVLYGSGSRSVLYTRSDESEWMWMHILTPTTNIGAIEVNGMKVDTSAFRSVPGLESWSYMTMDMRSVEKGSTISVKSTGDVFHLGILDASSAVRNAEGKKVVTSCSYGYFSSYKVEPEEPEMPDIPEKPEVPENPETPEIPETPKMPEVPEEHGDTIVRVHHVAMYMEGGYAHLPFGNSHYKWGMGYGAGIGLLYEYEHEHFLLNVGAGVLWQDVEHLSETNMTAPFIDTQGDESMVSMHIKRSDRVRMGYVEVPMLVGGVWNGFYLLGGVKIGVPLWGNTKCEARMTNYALYDQYFVPMSNMANHGLQVDVPTMRKELHPCYVADTRASLELGLNLERYRLGVFADYGVLWPALDHGDINWMQLTKSMEPSTWELHHPLNSSISNGTYVHSLLAGLKFTIRLF